MLSTHDHIDSASWRHWRFHEWALLSVDWTILSVERTLLSFCMDAFKLFETAADVSFRNPRDFRVGAANHPSTTISTMRMVSMLSSEATDHRRSGSP